jgi:hypothetical protein
MLISIDSVISGNIKNSKHDFSVTASNLDHHANDKEKANISSHDGSGNWFKM